MNTETVQNFEVISDKYNVCWSSTSGSYAHKFMAK